MQNQPNKKHHTLKAADESIDTPNRPFVQKWATLCETMTPPQLRTHEAGLLA